MTHFGSLGFWASYDGGRTLRLGRHSLIVRWRRYVPSDLAGWRCRLGPIEIHYRRFKA